MIKLLLSKYLSPSNPCKTNQNIWFWVPIIFCSFASKKGQTTFPILLDARSTNILKPVENLWYMSNWRISCWLPAGAFLKASTNICSSETWREIAFLGRRTLCHECYGRTRKIRHEFIINIIIKSWISSRNHHEIMESSLNHGFEIRITWGCLNIKGTRHLPGNFRRILAGP